MTFLLVVGCWTHIVAINYRIQAHTSGMGGETLMLLCAVPVWWLWAQLGRAAL